MKLKKIFNYFVTGLSSLFPITLTIYVLYKVFLFVDNISSWLIVKIFDKNIVGLGFLLTVSVIVLFGMLTKNYIIVKIMELLERLAMKIPLVQVLYSGLKELAGLFSSTEKRKFTQVVSLKFPNSEVDSIGFVTKETILFNGEEKAAVFIPTTPNPGNGFLIYTSMEKLVPLDIGIEEAIKCIVSMGTISPDLISNLAKK
ncbi:MAG: DUF502 domain-containing protein [Bacillota bacterium]|nr:DUF502 domain-containing protein [Bacillota bacterium]